MTRSAMIAIGVGLISFALSACSSSPEYRDPKMDPQQPIDKDYKGRAPSSGDEKENDPFHINADMTSFSLLTNRKMGRDLHPFVHVRGADAQAEIYFASDSDGSGFDIYKKNPVGSAVRKITSMGGNELWPTVSKDGRWMAFGSDRKGNLDIYVMDLRNQGAAPINVTNGHPTNDIHPTWSPDGKRLVYASYSPTLGSYVLKYVVFQGAMDEIASAESAPSNLAFGELPGQLQSQAAMEEKPMSMTSIANVSIIDRGTLVSNQGRTITGIHPDFRPSSKSMKGELVYQDYVRAGKRWNTIKLFDCDRGFITQIPLTEEYGAIQPRWSPDGSKIIFATVAKTSKHDVDAPAGADGFGITDPSGAGVQDLRNPTDRGQVADPFWIKVMGEERLYFTAASSKAEVLASIRLTRGN